MSRSPFTLTREMSLANPPIAAATARDWLRILDQTEDPLLTRLIAAATAQAEGALRRAIQHARYVQEYARLEARECVYLARPPFLQLEKVEWWDQQDNVWVLIDPAGYVARSDGEHAVVVPVERWPHAASVRFTFTAGHEAAAAPADVEQAVLDLVAHMYEHRGDTSDAVTGMWIVRHGALRVVML